MKKITTVFIDLDGVLVDWVNGMREYAGLPYSTFDCFRQDPSKLCHEAMNDLFGGKEILDKMMRERPPEFWYGLKKFLWADALINSMKAEFPISFLTKPGKNPHAASGKLKWKLDFYPDIPIIQTAEKYLCASETKVLIDDDTYQLNKFASAYGFILKWPNQFELEKLPMDYIQEVIINEFVDRIKDYEQTLE